jgi:hypothetical protein
MMRIFMGVARGLGDDNLLSMVRRYMDIHRMSHYESHTDAQLPGDQDGTLQYLDEAVELFFDDLLKPDGTMVQSNIIREDFMTNKLHAMRHYTDWVREKGSLPQVSTDRSESLHRIYKSLWRASNKGHESDKTVCLNEWRTTGMLIHNEELRREAAQELKGSRLENEVEEEDDDANATAGDGDENERGYNRLYEWEMELEDEPEFEHLSIEDEREEEVAAQITGELHKGKGRKQKVVKGVRFCGSKYKGYPKELEKAEDTLGLRDKKLVQETLRTLNWIKGNRQPGPRAVGGITLHGVKKVLVSAVFKSIECVYPRITSPNRLVKEILRCTDSFRLAGNSAWTEPRHDTVLVNYDRRNDAEGTMTGRRVAWLWCLFTVNLLSSPSLALVQWFDCKRTPEQVTNMFIITKTNKYEVIELSTIERGVHLIPNFGAIGSTNPWKELAKGDNPIPRGLDEYDRFVINNHLDLEIYNMIY